MAWEKVVPEISNTLATSCEASAVASRAFCELEVSRSVKLLNVPTYARDCVGRNGFEAKDGQLNTALQETEEGCTWSVEEIQCLRDDIEAASANGKKHAVCAQTEKALLSARLASVL